MIRLHPRNGGWVAKDEHTNLYLAIPPRNSIGPHWVKNWSDAHICSARWVIKWVLAQWGLVASGWVDDDLREHPL